VFLDTSVIIEVFRRRNDPEFLQRVERIVGDGELFVSIVQLAEVADWAVRNKLPPKERVAAVKEFARVVPLDERICLDAAETKAGRREKGYVDFSLLDGVVLASARSIGQRLMTLDGDFAGEADCHVERF